MKDYSYRFKMDVRDYECDMQGIVNNSVYQNYLEHARHNYLKNIGIDFKNYTERGIILVVVRAELDYRSPLRSGDRFWVGINLVRESRLKFAFYQDIYTIPEDRLVLEGRIVGTALNREGRPNLPEELVEAMERETGNAATG